MTAAPAPGNAAAALEVRGLVKRFGQFVALDGVDLRVAPREVRAVIGPNGAGKTTLINVLGGQLVADRGTVEVHGRRLGRQHPHQVAKLGVGRTFQISSTFRRMTVLDNMLYAHHAGGGRWFGLDAARLRRLREPAMAGLETIGLTHCADQVVDDVSHGDRKRLEFGMVLATRPTLLLLDEPTAGMGLGERQELIELVLSVARERGLTLVFVEHDIDAVFRAAESITVMALGRVFAEGTPGRDRGQRGGPGDLPRGPKMMLELARVEAAYGHARALHGIDLVVDEGEVVCIVGRNGAGKTSTLRSIVQDLITVTGGSVRFGGEDLVGLAPHEVVRRGIGYVPEDRRVFASLTVTENLTVPRSFAGAGTGAGAGYWTPARVEELFPPLAEFRGRLAGNLSGGQQQMLSIARSLLTNPRMLLLDEPHEGLAPLVARSVVEAIGRLKSLGVSMLLSEQQLHLVHETADRLYVVDRGRIVFSGTVAEFDADEEIARRYLMVAG